VYYDVILKIIAHNTRGKPLGMATGEGPSQATKSKKRRRRGGKKTSRRNMPVVPEG